MSKNSHKNSQSDEPQLADLIPHRKRSQLARDVGVSNSAVMRWIEANSVPPRRVIAVANALDVELFEIMPFARRATLPAVTLSKGEEDLDAILAAYEGRAYTTTLTERSVRTVLGVWGDRIPLLHRTLKQLKAKEISLDDAATTLGVTKSAVLGLRRRYGMSPAPRKAGKKPDGRYKQTTQLSRRIALDVIAGRTSALQASKTPGTSLRTLHRHISELLHPQTLNEISHWSGNFRLALAYEIEHGLERHTVQWRKWAESRNLLLKKHPKWPKMPKNLREVGFLQLLVLFLSGTMTLDEIAHSRGGEATVIMSRFKIELANRGMEPLKLTIHHQAAVAEIIVAELSHHRSGVSSV